MNREIKFRALYKNKEYEVQTVDKPLDGRGAHNFKGFEVNGGYILRKVKNHPLANSRGYYPEHRLILEESLGRFLLEDEVVHHEDQNRKNNDIKNLLIITQAEHAGKHFVGIRNPNGTRIAAQPIFSEIKFRLLDKDRNITRIYTLAQLIGTTFRRRQFEFRGRYTGLKDKNGKEIYEGDILNWEAEGQIERWEVKWNDKRAGWFLRGFLPIDVIANCEIIGNIYENPELLKS